MSKDRNANASGEEKTGGHSWVALVMAAYVLVPILIPMLPLLVGSGLLITLYCYWSTRKETR